jgi:hypothetical protein
MRRLVSPVVLFFLLAASVACQREPSQAFLGGLSARDGLAYGRGALIFVAVEGASTADELPLMYMDRPNLRAMAASEVEGLGCQRAPDGRVWCPLQKVLHPGQTPTLEWMECQELQERMHDRAGCYGTVPEQAVALFHPPPHCQQGNCDVQILVALQGQTAWTDPATSRGWNELTVRLDDLNARFEATIPALPEGTQRHIIVESAWPAVMIDAGRTRAHLVTVPVDLWLIRVFPLTEEELARCTPEQRARACFPDQNEPFVRVSAPQDR